MVADRGGRFARRAGNAAARLCPMRHRKLRDLRKAAGLGKNSARCPVPDRGAEPVQRPELGDRAARQDTGGARIRRAHDAGDRGGRRRSPARPDRLAVGQRARHAGFRRRATKLFSVPSGRHRGAPDRMRRRDPGRYRDGLPFLLRLVRRPALRRAARHGAHGGSGKPAFCRRRAFDRLDPHAGARRAGRRRLFRAAARPRLETRYDALSRPRPRYRRRRGDPPADGDGRQVRQTATASRPSAASAAGRRKRSARCSTSTPR